MSQKRMKAQMQARRLSGQQKRYRAVNRSSKPYPILFPMIGHHYVNPN